MTLPPARLLRRLQALARIKADAETARLAATAQSRGRLRAALADLGQPEPPLAPVIRTATADPVAAGGSCESHNLSPGLAPAMAPDQTPGMAPSLPPDLSPGLAPDLSPGMASDPTPSRASGQLAGATPGLAPGPASCPPTPQPLQPGSDDRPILEPALVRARLAHGVWIGTQRAHLNARLAMVEADWRRLQPVAARAFGRVQALDALALRSEAEARRDRSRRTEGALPPPDRPEAAAVTGPPDSGSHRGASLEPNRPANPESLRLP
jgi:hypothetical protein